jgi:hypothetical protein
VATDRNLLSTLLHDLRSFVDLMINMADDKEWCRATFGFAFGAGLVSELRRIRDAVDTVRTGQADIAAFTAAAAALAEVTEVVRVAQESLSDDELPVGVQISELVGLVLDAAGLSYLAARRPTLLYLARTLGLINDGLSSDQLVAGLRRLRRTLSARLDTEDDAQATSGYLGALGVAVALVPLLSEAWFHKHIDPRSFEVLFGWDPDPASGTPVADRVSRRMVTMAARHRFENPELPAGEPAAAGELELFLTLAFVPRGHGGPGLFVALGLGGLVDFPLGGGWHLVADGEFGDVLEFVVAGKNSLAGGGSGSGVEAEIRIERRDEGATPGAPAGPWRFGEVFEVGSGELALRFTDQQPNLTARLRLHDAALVLPRPESGVLSRLLPVGGLRLEFDLGVVVDSTGEWHVEGGTGLEVTLPVHSRSPKVQGAHAYLALATRPEGSTEGPAATFEASAGFGTRLGPFSAVVDRFGVVLPSAPHGLPGAPWLKFPNAIGIGLDGTAISGGGFVLFEPDRGRYAGALVFTVGRLTISAFGLLTDLPDDGFSLLVVGAVRFGPPLGQPGFALAGLGVLIGHNHGVDVAALQSAVRTGAVRDIFFPADPVAAAPRVLNALGTIFPVRPGGTLFGFGVEVTWSGGLVSLMLAVIWEWGQARRLLLFGSLDAVAGNRATPRLRVRVDVAGVIDWDRGTTEFDGSLVDSFIGRFTLTGDAVFRSASARGFLLALGGFHPEFEPPAELRLPEQRRLALGLASENPRIRFEAYLAVTANSIQLGGRLEISARAGGFSAETLLGFDALVEHSPFALNVDIEGRAAIRYDGTTLAAVGLDLHLDGPAPWTLHGTARLELLFFTVRIPIDKTFDGDDEPEQTSTADAVAALVAALAESAAWEAGAPVDRAGSVALRTADAAGGLAVHPGGRLSVRQSVLPLGIEISHIGPARVAAERFDITAVTVDGVAATVREVREPFAAGQYVDLPAAQRLSRPSFEPFVAGVEVGGAAVTHGAPVAADLSYEEVVIGPDGPVEPTPPRRPAVRPAVEHGATLGAAGRTVLRREETADRQRGAPRVRLLDIGVLAVDPVTLVAQAAAFRTRTEARQAGPALLVAAYEAAGA